METKNLKTYLLFSILLIASFIRLWKIDQVPVSLFGDELDVGYQAYSVLKTGEDYSGNFLPIHFQSLAEWRTPLYLYTSVPTVALFGISPLGVRLPAAIFGILGVFLFYLLTLELTGKKSLSLLVAFLLAISPWHIQYSRAGFEITQMLALYLAGLYYFFKGLKNGKLLVWSALFLGLTPWVYSTAKLFLPLTILALFIIWRKEILAVSKKHLAIAFTVFSIVVLPFAISTVFGGGTARFNYISVFSDPTTVPEVGFDRLHDAKMRGAGGVGTQPILTERLIHNKFTVWFVTIIRNYIQPYSASFLFLQGDLNARHSVQHFGEFYKIELIFLILGVIFFATKPLDPKIRKFIIFWLLAAPIPAAITRDGGTHATRLFFLLPPLVLLISIGIHYSYYWIKSSKKYIFLGVISVAYLISIIFYQHEYWIHYPWDSERWWHAGFEDAVKTAYSESPKYDKVIISMSSEPAYIFFLGWSQFSPSVLHANYPFKTEYVPGFGNISKLDKYYFGSIGAKEGFYDWSNILDKKTLYLASEKEVGINLILEPERTPGGLKLIKAFPYPSGLPAYYLFAKAGNE